MCKGEGDGGGVCGKFKFWNLYCKLKIILNYLLDFFFEKKFFDLCNNMERLKILIKKNCCFYYIFYIFGIKKIKGRLN